MTKPSRYCALTSAKRGLPVFKVRTSVPGYPPPTMQIVDAYVAARNTREAVKMLWVWSIDVEARDLKRVSDAPSNDEIKRLARGSHVVYREPGKTGVIPAHNNLTMRMP